MSRCKRKNVVVGNRFTMSTCFGRRTYGLALFCSIVSIGCQQQGPPNAPDNVTGAGVKVSVVVAEAEFPIAIAFAPDGRIFYTEKSTGRIRVIKEGVLLAEPFASVPVNGFFERGLLGITLHPDFERSGWVYVYYSRAGSGSPSLVPGDVLDNRVVRFKADGDVAADKEELIVSLPITVAGFHNAGNIRFGPDGMLYVSIGELGAEARAQDTGDLAGKILRYNDDGSVPDDGPFGPGNPVYATGCRNSFDLAFDPASGVLFTTENGAEDNDEINRVPGGANLGWPRVKGTADNGPGDPGNETDFAAATPNYVDPLIELGEVPRAPTGIDFAPNDLFGENTYGSLYYGEYLSGEVHRVALNDDRSAIVEDSVFLEGFDDRVVDVAFSPDGSMYVVTTRAIYQVTPG